MEYAAARETLRARRFERGAVATFVRRLDWVLLGGVAALVGIGLWAIAGITKHDVPGDENYYVVRQAIFAALGCIGLAAATLIDPALYRRFQKVLYGTTLGLMALVFVAGEVTRATRRWIDVGPFRFQPSEFGKVLLILFLGAFLADRAKRIGDGRTTLGAVGLAAVPMLLVFVQPDIGTTIVYAAALGGVLFIAGTRWLHLGALLGATVFAAAGILWLLPAAGVEVLAKYQGDRLASFLHPDEVPAGLTYNLNQSITAVASGQVSGRGVEAASQTRLDFLPEHATDFAFASFAEQRGFVGAAALLLLYLLVIWRGLRVVALARDQFSAIVAAGIVTALLVQVFVNVGMTIGIAPITGIPLPFVSVGGSSMISNLVAIGVLQAICARGRRSSRL
jgi:rod shape determining protein RodA